MIIRIMSKYELKRLAVSLGARIIAKLGPPLPEETGYCESIKVEEVSSSKLIRLVSNDDDNKFSTIVLRGNTKNTMDDLERAIDDAVNVY